MTCSTYTKISLTDCALNVPTLTRAHLWYCSNGCDTLFSTVFQAHFLTLFSPIAPHLRRLPGACVIKSDQEAELQVRCIHRGAVCLEKTPTSIIIPPWVTTLPHLRDTNPTAHAVAKTPCPGGRARAMLPHSPLSAAEGPGQHPRVPGTALGSPVSPQPGVLGQRPGVLHLPTDRGSSCPGAGPEVTQRRPLPPGHYSVSPGACSAATGQRVAKWLPQTASASGKTSERQLERLHRGDAPGSASPWSGGACERKASAVGGDGALWAAPLWSSAGGPLLYGGALEDAG